MLFFRLARNKIELSFRLTLWFNELTPSHREAQASPSLRRREGDRGGEFVMDGTICKDYLSYDEIYPDTTDVFSTV
jgi:hypothetical protein